MTDYADTTRRRNEATGRAMKRAARACQSCGRRQIPKRTVTPDAVFWTCRYCNHEHAFSAPGESNPEGEQ